MTDAQRLWDACKESIREQLTEGVWQTTFEEARVVAGEPGELVLAVPNMLVRERILYRYGPLVRDAIDGAGGTGCALRVEIVALPAGPLGADGDERADVEAGALPVAPAAGAAPGPRDGQTALNPDFTFEAFVIGEANRFAYAAARAAAESPAESYNPLFVYGASGLGKTHLLHAIGNYVRAQFPARQVKYVSTERFLNDYVNMIQRRTGDEFRRRYRQVDVLLIDDVQFLAGKEGLQDEFFHTFDELFQINSLLVLTSDTHPRHPDAA